MAETSVLLTGASVYDGSGADAVRADVLVVGERIAAVGPNLTAPPGASVVDVTGLDVLPGMIDVHSHDDAALFRPDGCEPKIRQGVTTTIIGNCGHGCAPTIPGGAMERYSSPVLGPFPAQTWRTFPDYLDDVASDSRTVNVGALVPHGPLRASVLGMERRTASDAELADLCRALDHAMGRGAIGLSFGMMYSPGNSADTRELVALAEVVTRQGGLVVAHVRNEADLIIEAIDELAHVADTTGVAVHVSHLKVTGPANVGRMPEVLARLDHHRANGIDLTTDIYPYEAGSSTAATLFPPWTADAGNASLLEVLGDPEGRARVADELRRPWVDEPIENYFASLGPDKLLLAGFTAAEHAGYEGLSIAAIARSRGQEAAECLIDLMLAEHGELTVVLFQIDIAGVATALAWPWTYVGSDGLPAARGYVHPRLYGTFPRTLNAYTGPGKVLSRAEGVRRMTSAPAARFGLHDRGLIRPQMSADLVVVDPDGPVDEATFESPRTYPTGIHAVIVNGAVAWRHGQERSTPRGRLLVSQKVRRTT